MYYCYIIADENIPCSIVTLDEFGETLWILDLVFEFKIKSNNEKTSEMITV